MKTGIAPGYLHGFSNDEQDRLYRQARFFESNIYEQVDFSKQSDILEVGCGVGAQTQILLERFPHIKVSGIDSSEEQIKRAETHLTKAMHDGRVSLQKGDALHLPFPDNRFDGAFLCWFLEHVQSPIEILEEVRRVLRPDGIIYCNEVFNATFYVHPYSPSLLKYWLEFNDHQWSLKGDPFVGGKLANYLIKSGFQEIQTRVISQHYDNRSPKRRAQFIEFWTELMLSGAPQLLQAQKVDAELVQSMQDEMQKLKADPDAVIFISWIQAQGKAF